jgi:PAS domain S-box-containing protein
MASTAPHEIPDGDPVSAVLENLGVIVFVADPHGRVTSVRGALTARLGYRPQEVLGKDLSLLVSAESAKLFEQNLRRQRLHPAAPAVYQITVLTKTRARVRMHVTTALLRDGRKTIGVAAILHPATEDEAAPRRPRLALTPRQHETLVLLSEGLGTDEIAGRLVVQRDTVRNHVRSLLRTLGAHSRLEAVVKARRAGLI